MHQSTALVSCLIVAPDYQLVSDLRRIALACAVDVGHASPIETAVRLQPETKRPSITLRISIECALVCQSVWKLVGRIASFCPQANVNAQIGDQAAAHKPTTAAPAPAFPHQRLIRAGQR